MPMQWPVTCGNRRSPTARAVVQPVPPLLRGRAIPLFRTGPYRLAEGPVPSAAPVRGRRCSGDAPAPAWALPGHPSHAALLCPRPEQGFSANRAGTRVGTGQASRPEPAAESYSGRWLRFPSCVWSAGRRPAAAPGPSRPVAVGGAAAAAAGTAEADLGPVVTAPVAAAPAPRPWAAGALHGPAGTADVAVGDLRAVRWRRRPCGGPDPGALRGDCRPIRATNSAGPRAPIRDGADRRPIATSTATAPAASAEEWMSRADAAEIARCSEATIKRLETKHDLETRSGPNGQTRLRLADLVRLAAYGPSTSRPARRRPGPPSCAAPRSS